VAPPAKASLAAPRGIGYKRAMKTRAGSEVAAPLRAGGEDARAARDLSAGENANLCRGCVQCCTYITVEIDAPRAAWEYDQWIWALHHRGVELYVEKPERWFLHFETQCRQLDHQGRCSIYGRHPVLCRDYDPRSCERRLPLSDIAAWFKDAEALEAWVRSKRPRHWKRLMEYRRDTAHPAPPQGGGTMAGTGLVTIASLTASDGASRAARRRSG